MNCKDERVLTWIVVEDNFSRCIGKNSAVPIELAVDTNCGKGGWECPRRHDVSWRNLSLTTVEITHLAGADVGRPHGKSRPATSHEREVGEFDQRLLQRRCRVEPGVLRSKTDMRTKKRERVWLEESLNSAGH